MRNTPLIFAFMPLLIPAHLYAADPNFLLDVRAGFKTGLTEEYVYESGTCISRLDWKDTFIPAVSLSGTAAFFSFFASGGVTLTLPLRAGTMEDYDFIPPGSAEPSYYSFHHAYLDKDFSWYLETGYRVTLKNLRLAPYLGFFWQNRKWQAADGYMDYPEYKEPQNVQGTVISYEQLLWFPYLGIRAEYTWKETVTVYTSAAVYPYLWARALDSHFLRRIQFYDTMAGGFGGKAACGVLFRPGGAGGCAFSFSVMYEGIRNVSGGTASGSIGIEDGGFTTDTSSGAKIESWNVQVFLGITVPVSLRLAEKPQPSEKVP